MGCNERRVEMSLEGDGVRQVAVSRFEFELTAQDQEQLRWYLEDFLEYPFDPASAIAAEVERRMTALGTELFDKVFGSTDGRDLWAMVRGRLEDTRVEIAAEIRETVELPWELLRDSRTDAPLALRADSFVHVHHQPARPLPLPSPEETELRVLLVISRPAGSRDVPFRSVARHLSRLSEDARYPFTLDVLRPPTFAKPSQILHDKARQGRPYHVVHFDGHGIYADLSTRDHQDRVGDPLRYGMLSPLRPGSHGYLLFEDPTAEANLQLVDGPATLMTSRSACSTTRGQSPTANAQATATSPAWSARTSPSSWPTLDASATPVCMRSQPSAISSRMDRARSPTSRKFAGSSRGSAPASSRHRSIPAGGAIHNPDLTICGQPRCLWITPHQTAHWSNACAKLSEVAGSLRSWTNGGGPGCGRGSLSGAG